MTTKKKTAKKPSTKAIGKVTLSVLKKGLEKVSEKMPTEKPAKRKATKKTKAKASKRPGKDTGAAGLIKTVRKLLGKTQGASELPLPGTVINAKVSVARIEGVAVTTDEGFKGLICAKSLGNDLAARKQKVGELVPGTTVRCVVRSVNQKNKRLSLELADGRQEGCYVIDAASVLGCIPSEVQGSALPKICDYIETAFSMQVRCVLKSSTLGWIKETNPSAYPALMAFSHDARCVFLQQSKAAAFDDDWVVLDLARSSGGYILSRDRYRNYSDEFAEELVRVRSFVPVSGVKGVRPYLLINGLKGRVEL